MTLNLTLNGEIRRFDGPLSVAGLIAVLGLDTRKVAIERNLAIVPRSQHEGAMLAEGDRVEIVEFIGGG
ncbi:MAG: sulfur carrier protein ThiS [Opitutaceae bacterium]|nr:sulfur carrier protein ThiS [Opitutaceae bacterium]